MYALEELNPDVAAQVDALSRRAWDDYEAALEFILHRPWDADVWNARVSPVARLRKFGLGRGSILYVPSGTGRTVRLEAVPFLRVQ